MRIAALSEATGLPVATLKFYMREGLVPSGVATAVNQAQYTEHHVRRARLVRALADVGGLSLADIRIVLDAVDDDTVPLHDAFGLAQDAMVPHRTAAIGDEVRLAARREVDAFVARHSLAVRDDAAVRDMLADALATMWTFGWPITTEVFDASVAAVRAQAADEIGTLEPSASRSDLLERSVIGTVVFERAAAAIRRMALEHASAVRFTDAP